MWRTTDWQKGTDSVEVYPRLPADPRFCCRLRAPAACAGGGAGGCGGEPRIGRKARIWLRPIRGFLTIRGSVAGSLSAFSVFSDSKVAARGGRP